MSGLDVEAIGLGDGKLDTTLPEAPFIFMKLMKLLLEYLVFTISYFQNL